MQLIAEARAAARGADPVGGLKAILERYLARTPDIEAALPTPLPDEALLHAGAELTVFHIRLPPGIQYPPHEHGMVALLGLYRGRETNLFYRRDAGALIAAGEIEYRAPAVVALPATAIHAVCNRDATPSAAIHLYLGDLTQQARSMWHPDLSGERPYEQSVYEAWGRAV
ncbi:MAG TPA: autotransporter [Vineibacter sp.]|nr:autotransporter [Vineibacter sp.]